MNIITLSGNMKAIEFPESKINALAQAARDIMESIGHDSFGPTDAVRALPCYDMLAPVEREAVHKALDRLIEEM